LIYNIDTIAETRSRSIAFFYSHYLFIYSNFSFYFFNNLSILINAHQLFFILGPKKSFNNSNSGNMFPL